MSADERLLRVVAGLRARQLTAPSRLLLDTFAPLDVLSSQVVLLIRPLLPLGRWRADLAVLEEREAWQTLRGLLHDDEAG